MDDFYNRFNYALKVRKISPVDVAKRLQISEATISNYRKGKYVPKRPRIEKIAELLNVNITWLLGYDAPMELSENASSDAEQLAAILSKMPTESVRQVLDFARYLLLQQNQ